VACARKELRTGSADSYVTPIGRMIVRFRDANRSLADPLDLGSERLICLVPVSHSTTHVPISQNIVCI